MDIMRRSVSKLLARDLTHILREKIRKSAKTMNAYADEMGIARNTLTNWIRDGHMPLWACIYICNDLDIVLKLEEANNETDL